MIRHGRNTFGDGFSETFERCGSRGGGLLGLAVAVAVVAAFATPAGGAAAKPAVTDDAALVDTLSKRGMGQLLDRYAQLHPADDPAEAALLKVARLRLQTETLSRRAAKIIADDPARAAELREQSAEVFTQMLDAQRTLAMDPDLKNRRARGIWLTDLSEMLLFDLLMTRENAAPLFYEFGVTTAQQREVYTARIAEALQAAALAEEAIFDVQSTYGRDAAARAADQGSGLYYRLLEDYGMQRTPLYAAMAMYGTALLPDDAPYFAQLGKDDGVKVPGQRSKPEDERRRLFQESADRLETFLDENPGGGEDTARALLGRVLAKLGRPGPGIEDQLDPVIENGSVQLPSLVALLGKAMALVELKRFPAALETLDAADHHALVADSPLYRLLAADARFRVWRAWAQSAKEGSAERKRYLGNAYDAYFSMLKDPALGGAAAGMRSMIYQRWVGDLEVGVSVDDLPPAVRMAVGEVARMKGQQALLVDGDETGGKKLLRWAVAVNGRLDDAELPDAARASGLFNGALADVLLNDGDVATLVGAVEAWLRVAEQFPQQPSAEQAITYAADYSAALMQQAVDNPAVRPLYEHAMRVLFEQYDTLDVAGRHRLFYAYTVYQQTGRYAEAAAQYARVPFGHPRYFEAQALRLFNLERAYVAAGKPTDRDALMKKTRSAAERLINEARPARRSATDEEARRNAARAQAAATLALVELDRQQGKPDAALQGLDDFEDEFRDVAGVDDLLRDALEKRILTLVSAGRLQDAGDEAERMMARFPQDAAGVITGVLTGLEEQITTKRRAAGENPAQAQALETEAATLADVASNLARLLIDWAAGQGFDDAEMLAYQLPYVRALRVAGRADEAAQYLRREDILENFGNDLDVLIVAGETFYALGVDATTGPGATFTLKDADAARTAATYLDRIITGVQPPYPDAYWDAWLRRLSINLALGEGAGDVPLRIRQLADTDPQLGGPAFKARFDALNAAALRQQ